MFIKTEKSEFITTIRSNAFTDFDFASLKEKEKAANALREIHSDNTVRAVVLILDSEENFTNTVEKEKLKLHRNIGRLIIDFPIPVILAVHGEVDFELAEAAHLCVASAKAKFVLPNNQHFNDTFVGEKIDSRKALKINLINKIALPPEVEKEAYLLAEKISQFAPLAIRACLKAVTKGLEIPLENGLKLEIELFTQMFSTEDMREGTRAFLEKREPHFLGK
jgi:enoyl-CoA hydratase/carnithine racemase